MQDAAKQKAILVVDFGTSNVRAILFDAGNGQVITSYSRKYETISPEPGFQELNPEEVWSLSVVCVKAVMDTAGSLVHVQALNFSFIGASLFPLDENFKPVYNCILCFDSRAVPKAKEMIPMFQTPTWKFSMWAPPAKILWLKEHKPETFSRTRYFWSIQQFILSRLGLEPVWEPSMANLHYMYDYTAGGWRQDVFDYVGIPRGMVETRMVSADKAVGSIRFYGDVNLGADVCVCAGSQDGGLGMLGLGCLGETGDVIAEVSGTFDHVGYLADMNPDKPIRVRCKPGPMEGTIVLMHVFPTYGADVEWFIRMFYGGNSAEAYEDLWSHCVFDGLPTKVTVNPAFSGDGMFAGMDLTTTKYDLFKGLIEALTFETRRSMEGVLQYKESGCRRIRIGGGPAVSDEWTQLRANITGKTIERVASNDNSALGAAVLAALGAGIYQDLPEAVEHLVEIRDSFVPDPELKQLYELRYQEYCGKVFREPE